MSIPAKEERINLPLETGCSEILAHPSTRTTEEWKQENEQAIKDVNAFMAELGHFSDKSRAF